MLPSRHKKLLAVRVCSGKCLLTLTRVCDCHRTRGKQLPDFIGTKLHTQKVTSVSHDIQLGGAVVILGLDVLVGVEVWIPFVCSVVPHFRVGEALPRVRHCTDFAPSTLNVSVRAFRQVMVDLVPTGMLPP